ncbi:MAG: ABC transporter ATP-binding protein [Patescibacteria group bacterium]|jgi:ATP-binding cassette subfamily B protein
MKANTRETINIYWQSVWKYKTSLLFSLVAIISASILNVITPLYYKKFIDSLAGGTGQDSIVKTLISILIIIAIVRLAQWVCWRIATFTANYFESKAMTDLTDSCFAFLHKHSFGFFNDNFVGSLVKKVKWFGRSFEVIADRLLWNLLPLVVNIAVIAIILFKRSSGLGFGVVAWVIVFLIINSLFVRYKLKYDLKRSLAETKTTGFLSDSVANHSTVKLFGGYGREISGFAGLNEKLRRLRKLTWDLGSLFEAVQGLLMTFLEVAIFYFAIGLWKKGLLTIGDFVLIQVYLINIFERVWDFGKFIRQIYEGLADADEMTEILQTPLEVQDAHGAKELTVTSGQINFSAVDFCYRQTREIFNGFNLDIKSHERVAIVGSSGAGKTTLVKMLLRLHDISSGAILIDGQDVARVTQESLHRNIGLVPQDPILFHRSLMENIRYGRPEATDDEVIVAARAAHCHEFISSIPEGYNTFVGERGVKLSSGERQRVAIARAILYNAPILILDEATSSLDSESERLIQDALEALMTGKTVIAIAHRLSTIKKMDRIIVIEKGKISEEGSHASLLRNQAGAYRHLWKLQAGGFIQ